MCYWKAVSSSGILTSKIVLKKVKQSERRGKKKQSFKGTKQQFKAALKMRDLRQSKFSVRRLHGTLITGYSIHVGRRLLREFRLYLTEVMGWQQRLYCCNLWILLIAATTEEAAYFTTANQQVSFSLSHRVKY